MVILDDVNTFLVVLDSSSPSASLAELYLSTLLLEEDYVIITQF